MSKPDFLCIGVQKGGTTWLHRMLKQNPDVWTGPLKEYSYFDTIYSPNQKIWKTSAISRAVERRKCALEQKGALNANDRDWLASIANEKIIFSEAWYEGIFSHHSADGKMRCDITPTYCSIPKKGIEYFREYLGEVPLVYIVRDPEKRDISQLRMIFHKRDETKIAEKMWFSHSSALNRNMSS